MKKFNIISLLLVSAFVLSSCGKTSDKANNKKEEIAVEDKAIDKKEGKVEEVKPQNPDQAEGNVILHRSYPRNKGAKSFTRIVVATSQDKIVGLSIDQYQYENSTSDLKAVVNSDKDFGKGAVKDKKLVSKMENEKLYSAEMKKSGAKTSLGENYEAIANFVKGKTIGEVEAFLKDKTDKQIMEAVGKTDFESTPYLIKAIVDSAKDNKFISVGHAEDPENLTFKTIIGKGHGDNSFADCLVAMEGDRIVAASFDEYQYLEDGLGLSNADDEFAKGYADSKNVLGSKLENSDKYSNLMAEKAKSKVSIKDNFEAIEKFVSGKTVDEIKDAIASKKDDGTIDSITGATLKDTASYLQLIVDASSK